MKRVLICLSVLVTLCQTNNTDKYLYLRTGEKTGAASQDGYINSGKDEIDTEIAKSNVNTAREGNSNERLNDNRLMDEEDRSEEHPRWAYQMDPMHVRRMADSSSSSELNSISSSREFRDWKEEWRDLWNKRKQETRNFSTQIQGDSVNMVAARPWGVPCGDPAQHDMPWGTCMLAVECNAEYRIYKGDYFCGRTQFVCCALNFHTYDLYQGLDASFAQSSMELDSAEERARAKKNNRDRHKRKGRAKKRRKRLREERKRKIKRTISKIVKEVQKVLEKAYRNGSKVRKKKTKTMKKFIKYLKKQYKLNRESAYDIHEQQLVDVDQNFMNKLMQIKELNKDFMTNDTFRSIIVNRTMTLRTAKWLAKSYPQLEGYFPPEMQDMDYTRQRKESARRTGEYHRRGDSERRRGDSERRRGDSERRRGDSERRRGDSERRRGDSERRRGNLAGLKGHRGGKGINMRLRGGIVRPRDRRKHFDYDVEYGLMYS